METFSQVNGKRPIDWRDRLGYLDGIDTLTHIRWIEDARSWVTCACGNQCAVIPRREMINGELSGRPYDKILEALGVGFYISISNRCPVAATLMLDAIEDRSAYLIEEEYKKLNVSNPLVALPVLEQAEKIITS